MAKVDIIFQRKLIHLLQGIEGMEKPERRNSLYMGFEVRERKWLDSRRVSDELADLSRIVEGVKELGKLDQLIENAKLLVLNPAIVGQLDALLQQIVEIQEKESQLIKGEEPVFVEERFYGTGNRWAVLVGINEYEDEVYGHLSVCTKDVEALHRQLIDNGYERERMHLIIDGDEQVPTRNTILVTLKAVASATEPDDLLLFYYSGHGDEDEEESYLVTKDGQHLLLQHTAMPVSLIKEIMKASRARAKIIILDACHSGANIDSKGPKPMSSAFIRRVFEEAEGLAILSSCKQGEKSFVWLSREQSVFTHFLLIGLQGEADYDGKGFVTIDDANKYLVDKVKLWSSQNKKKQTPTLNKEVVGDIILSYYA